MGWTQGAVDLLLQETGERRHSEPAAGLGGNGRIASTVENGRRYGPVHRVLWLGSIASPLRMSLTHDVVNMISLFNVK